MSRETYEFLHVYVSFKHGNMYEINKAVVMMIDGQYVEEKNWMQFLAEQGRKGYSTGMSVPQGAVGTVGFLVVLQRKVK